MPALAPFTALRISYILIAWFPGNPNCLEKVSVLYINSLVKVSKKGELLDFVVEHAVRVLPIEVKSGKDYEKHSALDNMMAAREYGIEEAYISPTITQRWMDS